MAIVTRASKGSALTYDEMDNNFNQVPNGANSSITDDGSGIVVSGTNKLEKLNRNIYYGKNINSDIADGSSVTIAKLNSGTDKAGALLRITACSYGGDGAEAVFKCYNDSGTWNVSKQDVFTGTNLTLVAETADSGSTYEFKVKASGGTVQRNIKVIVIGTGGSIDTSYIER